MYGIWGSLLLTIEEVLYVDATFLRKRFSCVTQSEGGIQDLYSFPDEDEEHKGT